MPRAFQPPAPTPGTREPDIISLLQDIRRNPLTLWRKVHFEKRHVSGRGLFGYGVVLSDPAAIRHVLVENAGNYRKDDLQRKVLAPGLGEGLLTAEGDVWRATRRTVAPLFTPRRVSALASAMQPPLAACVARWARKSGSRVDVSALMTEATFDVLAATLFSNVIDGGAAAFSAALTRYFETQGRIDPLDVLNAPAWLPRIGRLRAQGSIDFFERQVRTIVAARRSALQGGSRPDDLLTALLEAQDPDSGAGLGDLEVGANIVTFIGAGHETTANALTWALYLLSQASDVAARVEAEADAIDNHGDAAVQTIAGRSDALAWTRAVIEEAMRLYPPVPSLSRTALGDDRAAGIRIPRGALVVIAPYVLHRHSMLWPDADAFRPERFLPGARATIDRFAYLPFGAGPRVCIGQQFAMVEAVLALTLITRSLRLVPDGSPRPVPVHHITLRPQGGLTLRLVARQDPGTARAPR